MSGKTRQSEEYPSPNGVTARQARAQQEALESAESSKTTRLRLRIAD